jgi:hypothetical protein
MHAAIAMGIGPMTADICEAMTYASALTTGTIADTVPKPIEVSNAISSAHPNLSTGLTVPEVSAGAYFTSAAR